MLADTISTFLVSLSPLGESRVGIPYGIIQGLPVLLAFTVGLIGNLLVFPVFNTAIDLFNKTLWPNHTYRNASLWMMRRSKKLVGKQIEKHGFWGLMLFVMIPLPVTGAYMGVIGAKVFRINAKTAFLAISIGLTVSASIITVASHWLS